MPKSKRNKQIELAKTKKRGLEWKKKLFEEIRSAVDSYSTVYVFTVNDMRNSKMKNVREQWKDSRFFIGKNKIMAMSLGRFAEEEYKPNLHKIGQRIKGQRALLFSNRSTDDVLSWFRSYSEGDFARSGNTATEDVKLLEGPLPQFPHSLEPYLRQLGLPTTLVKGVIHLVKDHEVCKEGDILTPETAKILKLLGYEMAEFHITINCMWSQDGTFLKFTEDEELDTKENRKKNKRKSNSIVVAKTTPNRVTTEEMEIEEDEMSDSSEAPQLQEIGCNTPKVIAVGKAVSPKAFSGNANTSTPKEKVTNSVEIGQDDEEYTIFKAEQEMKFSEDMPVNRKKKKNTRTLKEKITNSVEINQDAEEHNQNLEECTNLSDEKEIQISEDMPVNRKKKKNTKTHKEKIINSVEINQDTEEHNQNLEECAILSAEKEMQVSEDMPVNRKTKKAGKPSKSVNDEDEVSGSRQGRSRKRQVNLDSVSPKDSIFKTPDIANSSQESPVFRELRNRSVKVNRKRNKK